MDYCLEAEKKLSRAKNYNNWIFNSFKGLYGKCILDVGSSIGNIVDLMFKNLEPEFVVCIDSSREALEYAEKRFVGRGNFHAHQVEIQDEAVLGLKKYGFDTITCFNVLEHVEEDEKALKHMFELLPEGGRLLLFVPAFPMLYGRVDEATGHYRRYTKTGVNKKLVDAGFRNIQSRYINFFGLFSWLVYGKISRKHSYPSEKTITVMDKLALLLSKIESVLKPPIGLSLACTCEK
jgi:SAM-dependent methyltransferase